MLLNKININFHQSSDSIIPLCRTKFASWEKNLNLNILKKKKTKIITAKQMVIFHILKDKQGI